MDELDRKKEKKADDIEIPTLDNEIQNWCEVPTEDSNRKSADDLAINSWCEGSPDEEETVKKEKKKQ
ncbi:hypothetical protein V7O66_04645 [Methanolobus sp. ZRKC3]|uniref:hypothetical protein n=1 Tax=Methanolobus sp. ZRKC3 TaxID=3125786 RepID=UPI003254FDC2